MMILAFLVATAQIFSYYASIILHALAYLLCSKLCWHNVLKFHSHVSTIVLKANRTLGMIKKCFTALNQ